MSPGLLYFCLHIHDIAVQPAGDRFLKGRGLDGDINLGSLVKVVAPSIDLNAPVLEGVDQVPGALEAPEGVFPVEIVKDFEIDSLASDRPEGIQVIGPDI